MKRLAAGSALAAGALAVLYVTLLSGPQPKPTGPLVGCVVIAADCPGADGGRRYRVATIAADPLDSGMPVDERIALFDQMLESRDCVRAGPAWVDPDGGACLAQANAVRVRDVGDVAFPCRCASDAGWRRVPCVMLAGRHDPAAEFGCTSNVSEIP